MESRANMKKYTIEEIKNAVDIATGDDGFRGKEVIAILQTDVKKNTEEYLKTKLTPMTEEEEYRNAGITKEEINK